MSGAALRDHLRLLDELRQIVGAMRNLAYAEVQRLGRMTAAQALAQQAVLQALADTGATADRPAGPATWLLIGAERGFCGGFNEHLLAALPPLREQFPTARWLAAGERLLQHADQLPPAATALAGSASAEECMSTVDAWMDILQPQLASARTFGVLHHTAQGPVQQLLLPDPPLPAPGPAPLRYLPAPALTAGLRAEWLRIGLLGALCESLLQENRWRLAQMQRAQDHLDEAGEQLRRNYFRQRQADITGELETLMSSLDATGSMAFGARRAPGGRHPV